MNSGPAAESEPSVRPKGTLLAASAAFLFATTAPAASPAQWGGFVAATSDYVLRGVSETRGQPALQADLHFDSGAGSFIGVWASTLRPTRAIDTTLEFDFYAGHSWFVSTDWRIRTSVVHYEYLDSSWQGPRDYDELNAALAFRDRMVVSVAWSPNVWWYSPAGGPARRSAMSYEFTARQPLAGSWYVAGGAGYYDVQRFGDGGYFFWNAGLGFARAQYRVDLATFGLDASDRSLLYSDNERGRWALTLTWQF